LVVSALGLTTLAHAATPVGGAIEGKAFVLDGDTVELAGERVRLWGVDAPEMETPAGWYARATLDELAALGPWRCAVRDVDKHKRRVARCLTHTGDDVALLMLERGMAVVFRTYAQSDPALSKRYEAAEREARVKRTGFWADMP
jgi:endonuclease YncB( thermonuclease family)